ncbi:hypothetical protein DFP96_10778 [Listeria rocourtiae]|uniref:TVP38/TMEM64 family membrane protein n=1 Tax=Listeria rocourtiae TaxID=647910 RepID=A0A4R6ZJU3_9LIST|nr:hypothetical protein [Listeria rocourtiae]EUJ47806.1 hypothetical protein PROCOU_07328 [Listeria rocourtiae FSL F6-920]TDR52641.1 hypothetical protein DFP96_10778 [Listeria rocourtiae]
MNIRLKVMFIVLGLIAIIILGYIIYKDYSADFKLFLDPDADRTQLMESIRRHKLKDALLLVALTAIMCAIPGVPNSVIGILIGVSFGPWLGVLMNATGNILGNFIVIIMLRKFGISKKANRSNQFIKSKQVKSIHSQYFTHEKTVLRHHSGLHDSNTPIRYRELHSSQIKNTTKITFASDYIRCFTYFIPICIWRGCVTKRKY